VSGANVQHAAAEADRFSAAYRSLREDPSIQFVLLPPKPRAPPPEWLRALGRWLHDVFSPVGRFLAWIGSFMPDAPYARIFLWAVITLAAIALLWMIVERVRHGEWRLPRRGKRAAAESAADDPEAAWIPDEAPVRAWLREADALATEGRFAEAIHLLLFRSVEDIQRRRPAAVRPALTSRELASSAAIPRTARAMFARIAGAVEASVFGGRPVDAGGWADARAAYADFAAAGAWKAGATQAGAGGA
jgi:hypothetical protein